MDEEIDFTRLKYALYARKSTDDPERQLRSIPDQIDECRKYAHRNNLTIKVVLQEKHSAKKPNKRPIFSKLLKDLKNGTYDGILAWNPDRLARNMKEGGIVIDMIDEGEIKDLKFVTHHFTKDASGKMLLGMAFVLSKQYSDNLSQNVTRGVRRSLAEGKSGVPKHGYIRDEDGYLRPDDSNFELIRNAWQMRKSSDGLEKITKYMNDNGYGRIIKKTGTRVKMSIQRLSDIFKDPFYYGILIQAGSPVDLREKYDFQPAITQEDYNLVQQLSYRKIKPSKPHRLVFYPLRKMVICSFCNENMVVGPSTGSKGTKYLNYRCDNKPVCLRKKKSIRARVVFNFIYKFLEEGLNFAEKEYNEYYSDIKKTIENKRNKIAIELHSKRGLLTVIEADIRDRSLKVLDFDKKSTVRKVNESQIEELELQKLQLESDISGLKDQLVDPEKERLSIEQFLNLSKNASAIVQSANAVIKDQICRLIFLNFTVDEEKVLSYQLKEPFGTLLKNREFLDGRGDKN
jgi:DNA invertase Pin-like site-specific DNA recombinase